MEQQVNRISVLGENLPKLGLGAMRLPMQDGVICQQTVNEMVAYALQNGVNYFDTSIVYHGGSSEIALGIALEPHERSSYFLADKMSFWDCNSEEYLDQTFETSCKKLKTDYIDFYLLHSMNDLTWTAAKKYDAINWAIEKKKQGKIKHLGFSIHADADLLTEILDQYDWDFVQIQYNYMDEQDNPGKKGYEELIKRNIPIMIMEPLKGGVLVDIPDHITTPFTALGGSNASFAFRWLAEKNGIATILSGMSNMEQLKQNIKIFKGIQPLSNEEREAIVSVRNNIAAAQKVRCTGCRYCMPCPVGIDIPGTFKAWNLKAMQKNSNWINGTSINKDNLDKCASCGQCATHCPQNIDIPQTLKTILAE